MWWTSESVIVSGVRTAKLKSRNILLAAAATLGGVFAFTIPQASVTRIPPGYRDWKLISVAREEGSLDDIRAILGNDTAVRAYRADKLPFPDGSIIARIAWSLDASEENNKVFGKAQSFVAGHPKNGVQFMVKNSRKYAATGGWGYGQFDDGKAADEAKLKTCYPCHQSVQARDFVFTRYAP
jgi:hypothetical protein